MGYTYAVWPGHVVSIAVILPFCQMKEMTSSSQAYRAARLVPAVCDCDVALYEQGVVIFVPLST